MKTIATDKNNDIFLSGGKLALSEGKDAISNICLNRIRTLKGEHQYNTQDGIAYFDILFGFYPNIDLFKYYIQREILAVNGVNSIKSLTTDISNSTLTYQAEIETNEGVVKI